MKNNLENLKDKINGQDVGKIAFAIVVSLASVRIVEAVVENVFMPILSLFSEKNNWHLIVWKIGRLEIPAGPLLSEILIFTILIWIAFGIMLHEKSREDRTPGEK